MRICTDPNTADCLDELHDVLVFLCDAFCGSREVSFGDASLCGAQRIFWAVQEDLRELANIARNPGEDSGNAAYKHPINGVESPQGVSGHAGCVRSDSEARKRPCGVNPHFGLCPGEEVWPSS